MLKVKDMVFDILLGKADFDNKLKIGNSTIDIEANEILGILLKNGFIKSKSSINKALSELQEDGLISFESSERTKIKQITINNILFSSKYENYNLAFNFDINYHNQLLDSCNLDNGISLISNIKNNELFNDSLNITIKCAEVLINGENILNKVENNLLNSVIIGVDEDIIYNLSANNGFVFKMENSRPLHSFFPQNLRNFRTNCGKIRYMYVLSNNMYYNYIKEYSTLDLVFPQNLRKFRRLKKESSLDNHKLSWDKSNIGKKNMNVVSLLEKSKNNYKTTQEKSGNDLFGSSSNNEWKDVEDHKRNYNNLPICAFKAFEWISYVSNMYEKINDKPYPRTRNSDAMLLANKVYPKIFDELKWSAEDLKAFIDKSLHPSKSNKSRESFILGFIVSNEIRMNDIENFSKERKDLRNNDYYENIIYMPHIPILSENEINDSPLDKILEANITSDLAVIYNYGICNYHRFLQLSGNSFEESTAKIANFLKTEVIGKLLAKDRDVAIRYIRGMAKNTMLWEPYSENESCRPARNVLNWREEFSKLWKNKEVDVTTSNWWREYPNYGNSVIPSVKKIFSSTKKIINVSA